MFTVRMNYQFSSLNILIMKITLSQIITKRKRRKLVSIKKTVNEFQLFIFLQVWGHLQNMSTVFVRTRVKQQLMALHYTNIKQFAKTFWLG